MNRRLAANVIAAFRDVQPEVLRARFASLDERDWLRSEAWLHTSGLALYFLGRARALGIEDVMPAQVLHGLQRSQAENRVRTDDLFREFMRINMEFQRAKLSYANLKGFTLAPRSCSDPADRYQHDLDFLVSRRDSDRCREALKRQGYRLTAAFGDTWEFTAGHGEMVSLRDLYKVRSQRSLEVHLVSDKEQAESDRCGDRLSRLQLQVWNGFEFPALSERDKLLEQARHLFKHFTSEWTRTAWILEYANAIRSHQDDLPFWREIAAVIEDIPEQKIGIGVATRITSRAFGAVPHTRFLACSVDTLPEHLRLWVDHYHDELVFNEHPGSKLYLLLKDVLQQDNPEWSQRKREKLLPIHVPPQAIQAARGNGAWPRLKATCAQTRFVWKRLRFHAAEGLRYKIEAARWKKFVASLQN